MMCAKNTTKCKNCVFWVEEDENLDYSHNLAVMLNKGFCVLQDLYTHKKPDDKCNLE